MSQSRPVRAFVAVLAAAIAGGVLLTAYPAAAVPGLVTAQRTSVSNSTAEKVVTVPCPTGTRAIGGSAVIGGSTRVRINAEVPDPTSYTVLAREPRGGVSEDWFVVVTVHCAPVGSLPGLEYRRTSSPFDSGATHGASAACSPGKRLIGAGGLVDSNGPGQDTLVLTAVRPSTDLVRVAVSGAEDERGYAGGWRAIAVAVCIAPVAGQQLVSATSAYNSSGFKPVVAVCPSGTRIHSGGFDTGSGAGQVSLTASFLDYDVASDPSRHGFEAQAREDQTGYSGSWRVVTFAICAP